eukprot:gene11456-12653_t
MERTIEDLQNRLAAMQAAVEGNAQSGLFKTPHFSGLPHEDVNEWVKKFDRLSNFNAEPSKSGRPVNALNFAGNFADPPSKNSHFQDTIRNDLTNFKSDMIAAVDQRIAAATYHPQHSSGNDFFQQAQRGGGNFNGRGGGYRDARFSSNAHLSAPSTKLCYPAAPSGMRITTSQLSYAGFKRSRAFSMGELKAPDINHIFKTPLNEHDDSVLQTDNKRLDLTPAHEPGIAHTQTVPCLSCDTLNTDDKSTSGNVLIWGTVFSNNVKFLIDTGAAVTVINAEFYNSILKPHSAQLSPSEGIERIQTATGASVSVMGSVSFPLHISDKSYQCRASIIPGLAYNVVLGRDFLHENKAVIDVHNQSMTFDQSDNISFAGTEPPSLCCLVIVDSTQIVEPCSEAIIPAFLIDKPEGNSCGLLEGNDSLVTRHRLIGAASVSSPVSSVDVKPSINNNILLASVQSQLQVANSPDLSEEENIALANSTALGYVLGQRINNVEYVVSYGGRELNSAATRYSATEREALAVVAGIKRYRPYVYGSKFYVHTDHSSLSWLMKMKDPTGRLTRWALLLQQFDFDIIYRPGSSNCNADALSRRSYTSPPASASADVLALPVVAVEHPCPDPPQLADLQRHDRDLFVIIEYLEKSVLPTDNHRARSILLLADSFYLTEQGVLCHLWSPGKRHNLENARRIVQSNTELAQLRMKQQYDKHAAPVPFLRTVDNRPVSVPVHVNRMRPYIDPASRPISAPSSQDTTPDLVDNDLPADSFVPDALPILLPDTPSIDTEPTITRPEDVHTPQTIVPV